MKKTTWSKKELERLEELYDDDNLTWSEIADTLNTEFHNNKPIRTKFAVSYTYFKMSGEIQ